MLFIMCNKLDIELKKSNEYLFTSICQSVFSCLVVQVDLTRSVFDHQRQMISFHILYRNIEMFLGLKTQ